MVNEFLSFSFHHFSRPKPDILAMIEQSILQLEQSIFQLEQLLYKYIINMPSLSLLYKQVIFYHSVQRNRRPL